MISIMADWAKHEKLIIVNFLLRKNLAIDFVKNVQKNKNMMDSFTEYPSINSGQVQCTS
jgi:hypothetical protein